MKSSFGSLPRWMRTSTPSSVSSEPMPRPNDRRKRHSRLLQFDGCQIPRQWLTSVKSQVGYMSCSHHIIYIDPDYAMSLVESVTNRADVPNPDARVDGRNDVIYFWMERVLMVLRRLFIKDAYKAMHPLIIIRVYGFERVEPWNHFPISFLFHFRARFYHIRTHSPI